MQGMGLDIRRPLGLLFMILGVMLVVYGVLADKSMYQRSLGYNVNADWGAIMFLFGLVVSILAMRGAPTTRPAETTPEGQATEAREHARHLESDDPPKRGH